MKVKISKKGTYSDNEGKPFSNYKIFLYGRAFWLSDLDFKDQHALEVEDEYLFLKKPLEDHYSVAKKTTDKGHFLILRPISTSEKTKSTEEVGEPQTEYTIKSQLFKKIKDARKETAKSMNEKLWSLIKSKNNAELQKLLNAEESNKNKNVAIARKDLNPAQQIKDKAQIDELLEELNLPKPKKNEATDTSSGSQKRISNTSTVNARLQFLQTLLQLGVQKNVNEKTREKLLELASREMERETLVESRIIKEIDELKSLLKPKLKELNNARQREVEEKNIVSKHRPRDTADFMNLFSIRNGFKWLVHDYDEADAGFQITPFIQKSKVLFDEFVINHYIPNSLYSIMNQFCFTENPSWGKGIKMGWSHPEWIEWSNKNNLHPMQNPKYYSVIQKFRALTRIESPMLETIIKEELNKVCRKSRKSLNIEITDCQKADIYTHTDYLKAALNLIFEGIAKKSDISNRCTVRFLRKTEGQYKKKIIQICHSKSFLTKPIDELYDQLANGSKGDFHTIRKKLRGYCDWSIETKYEKQGIIMHLLSDMENIEIMMDDEAGKDGFTHVLTFYEK